MPRKKYYNPQDDVVKIVDGKREPVQAYDMYKAMHQDPMQSVKSKQAEKTNAPEKTKQAEQTQVTQEPSQKDNEQTENGKEQTPALSLRFDGQNLTLIAEQNGITTEYDFAAVSGRPEEGTKNTFTYGKERQFIPNVGPIPEGEHTLMPQTGKYWKDLNVKDKAKSLVSPLLQHYFHKKSGAMPGGPIPWGEGFIDVNLDPEVQDQTGRSGITVHGGAQPGSAGCIDLVCNDEKFFKTLEQLNPDKKEIPLVVDYSNTPEEVHFPINSCKNKKKWYNIF